GAGGAAGAGGGCVSAGDPAVRGETRDLRDSRDIRDARERPSDPVNWSLWSPLGPSFLSVALSVAAAVLLQRLLPLPAGDAFRGTLVILPLILGALHEIHRWGARLGGGTLGVASTAGELGALAVLILPILGPLPLPLAVGRQV